MIPKCKMNKQAGLVMVHGQVRLHLNWERQTKEKGEEEREARREEHRERQ